MNLKNGFALLDCNYFSKNSYFSVLPEIFPLVVVLEVGALQLHEDEPAEAEVEHVHDQQHQPAKDLHGALVTKACN